VQTLLSLSDTIWVGVQAASWGGVQVAARRRRSLGCLPQPALTASPAVLMLPMRVGISGPCSIDLGSTHALPVKSSEIICDCHKKKSFNGIWNMCIGRDQGRFLTLFRKKIKCFIHLIVETVDVLGISYSLEYLRREIKNSSYNPFQISSASDVVSACVLRVRL
jgi:hypothetical protein